jgi:hypothetical protein
MKKTAKGFMAAVGALALVVGLSKMASGSSCMTLVPGVRYYFNYNGARKLLPAAIGAGWTSIFYVETWNSALGDWEQPVDPVNYYLEPGARCAIRVMADILLCGFGYMGQEAI